MRAVLVSSLLCAAAAVGCSSEEQCYATELWRCVESDVGSPCTLDRGYNLTGLCSCGVEACEPLAATAATPGKKQYLVIGDSISLGYFDTLKSELEPQGWELFHAPGNNDNANWGNKCLVGWLGDDPRRWDAISLNFGLHDLAFPDNEHLELDTYEMLLRAIRAQLQALIREDAALHWVTTTPVPTSPPPDPATGQDCTLIPGRAEADVRRYNGAAARAMAGLRTCDLHQVVVNHCGDGYATCDIAQCAGPHYVGDGFPMLGRAVAECVRVAWSERGAAPVFLA